MADIRIETEQALMEDSPDGNLEFSPNQMKNQVKAYWGSAAQEKLFPIPYWRAAELLAQSPSKQLAFKVTNIEDPTLVTAEWISYDPANPGVSSGDSPGGFIGFLQGLIDSLKSLTSPDPPIALFVFGEELFPLDSDSRDGLRQFTPHRLMTILGRIGRTDRGNTAAFIVGGLLEILEEGGGGPGATTGAKIPSDDDE